MSLTSSLVLRRLVAIHDGLDSQGLRHAFGGAIALAFHVQDPRATSDIDINVTTDPDDPALVFRALPSAVRWDDNDVRRCRADGQVRLYWREQPFDTPVDLFLPQHALHAALANGVERVTVVEREVDIVSATHLTVLKALFGRTKDWADIEEMLSRGKVDLYEVSSWLDAIVGPDDERHTRLRHAREQAHRGAPTARELFTRPQHDPAGPPT